MGKICFNCGSHRTYSKKGWFECIDCGRELRNGKYYSKGGTKYKKDKPYWKQRRYEQYTNAYVNYQRKRTKTRNSKKRKVKDVRYKRKTWRN